ncbi:MAG: heavy-metal-associated domain-containing protein, partial [Candidatus Heimdallarchaeota archaeon]|nr:heavy-metal-associated domain-containing protein [Candidatus Heimdallarchaeota archaeon]
KIEGMTCGSCSKAITARVSKFDFTSDVSIDHESDSGKMDVSGDFDENKGKIIAAINQIGYKVVE